MLPTGPIGGRVPPFESLTAAVQRLPRATTRARLNANDDKGRTAGGGLVATDGRLSSAVLASSGFTQTSSGYADRSDGYTDLSKNFKMDWSYTARDRGNVVQTGATRLTGLAGGQRLQLALGFARKSDVACAGPRGSNRGFGSARGSSRGWRQYSPRSIPVPRAPAPRYPSTAPPCAAGLTRGQDVPRGFVAAPGRPWAWRDELSTYPVTSRVGRATFTRSWTAAGGRHLRA